MTCDMILYSLNWKNNIIIHFDTVFMDVEILNFSIKHNIATFTPSQ